MDRTKTVSECFDDLLVRFIINSPAEEITSIERLGFLIEQAYWFYDDFYYDANPDTLTKYPSLKSFAIALFEHCPEIFPVAPSLSGEACSFEQEFAKFLRYKSSVPVVGAIMFDEGRKNILLVQGFHAKGNQWTFPKGKINQNEKYEDCAVREVFEETSYDISPHLIKNNFIEIVNENQLIRLYIVENVSFDAKFFPRTRKEIKSIQWFNAEKLFQSKPSNISIFLMKLKRFMKTNMEKPKKPAKKDLLQLLKSSDSSKEAISTKSPHAPTVEHQVSVGAFRLALQSRIDDLRQIIREVQSVSMESFYGC